MMIDGSSIQSFQIGLTYELNKQYGKAMFHYDIATHSDRSNYYAKYRRLMVEYYKNLNRMIDKDRIKKETFLTYVALRKQYELFHNEMDLSIEHIFIEVSLGDYGQLVFRTVTKPDPASVKTMRTWTMGDTISLIGDAIELVSDNRWEQGYLKLEARRYDPPNNMSRKRRNAELRAENRWEEQLRRYNEQKEKIKRDMERIQGGLMAEREKVGTLVIKQNEKTGALEEPISSGPIDIDPSLHKESKNRGWGRRD